MSHQRFRVVVAVDLQEELCDLIEKLEPRCEVVRDHRLYRPQRFIADWGGDPQHERTSEEQASFEAMVDSADALFSLPDVDPAALARTVRANPGLRWVHGTAAGAGSQVKAAGLTVEELDRITFTTSAGVHGDSLAEFAVFGIFAGAKDLVRLQAQQKDRLWSNRWTMRQVGDMNILVAGLGGIGQAVAVRLKALGATVWGTSRRSRPVDGVDQLVQVDDLISVMAQIDAVVVTLPGTTETESLFSCELFNAAKPNLIVVNVGRGTVIDEVALVEALESGQVGFAALDVFEEEPLPEQSPLWVYPNVLVSPHTAGLKASEPELIARLFAKNATRFLDGKKMENVVDTVNFY